MEKVIVGKASKWPLVGPAANDLTIKLEDEDVFQKIREKCQKIAKIARVSPKQNRTRTR